MTNIPKKKSMMDLSSGERNSLFAFIDDISQRFGVDVFTKDIFIHITSCLSKSQPLPYFVIDNLWKAIYGYALLALTQYNPALFAPLVGSSDFFPSQSNAEEEPLQ